MFVTPKSCPETTHSSCPKIGNKFDSYLKDYLHKRIRDELTSQADDFFNILKENVQQNVNSIFSSITLPDSEYLSTYTYHMRLWSSCSDARYPEVELIFKIVSETLQLRVYEGSIKSTKFDHIASNTFGRNILKNDCDYACSFDLTWTPKNPFFYQSKRNWVQKYHYNPEKIQEIFRAHLQNGDLNTILEVHVGEKIYKQPQRILEDQSDFFKNLCKSDMKESLEGFVTLKECTEITFELFIEFCNFGKIDPKSTENIKILLTLFKFANQMQAENFFNYCSDLLHTWVDDHPISSNNLEEYIKAMNQCDLDIFCKPLFQLAKKEADNGDKTYLRRILASGPDFSEKYLDWLSNQC